jgi:rhodanese-related sulfurtransferase
MKTVIVDVRSEKEFLEGSYPGAIHIPFGESNLLRYQAYQKDHIALVCFSGNRAQKVKTLLEAQGYSHVSLLQNQMVHLEEQREAKSTLWTIDRQFRMALGILLGLGISLNLLFYSSASMTLLFGLFVGLMYSSITDNCYLKTFISNLPWNKKKSMDSISENQKVITI